MYKTILIPLDGSERAEAILPHVEELAYRHQAHLIFIQVIEPPILIAPPGQPDFTLYHREWEQRRVVAQKYLQALEDKYQKAGFEVSFEIQEGPVVDAIIQTAEKHHADLIAFASHGRSGLAQVFYGSVAAGVLQRADRPLLLVRSQTG